MRLCGVLLFLAGMAAVFVSGCAQKGSANGKAGGGPVVRVGFFANVTHAVPLVGFSGERKAFEGASQGVSFEPHVFHAGPEAIEALRAGAVDMAFIGPGPAITAYWKGRDIVILAGSMSGGTVLVTRPGAKIASVADLAGKKVAVPQIGNTQDVLLRYQMALNGLRSAEDGGKVTVQPMANADILAMFQRGQLDAACVPEPWGSRLEREAGATVLLGSAALFNEGRYPVTVLIARREFAEKNPALVKAFTESVKRLTSDLAKDPNAVAGILSDEIRRHTGKRVPEEDIRRSMRRCRFTPEITQHDVHVFANLVEVAGYKSDITASLDGIIWRSTP